MLKRTNILLFFFSITLINTLSADHRINRFFPAYEQTDLYTNTEQPRLFASNFFSTANRAFERHRGFSVGNGELNGNYDLQDIINSVQSVSSNSSAITNILGTKFANVTLPFSIGERISAIGAYLSFDYPLKKLPLVLGLRLPFAHVVGTEFYEFNTTYFLSKMQNEGIVVTEAEQATIAEVADKARRKAHDLMHITVNDWTQDTLGDLDLYGRWNYYADHQLLMRSINLNVQVGLTFPTSKLTDTKHPASIPFAHNGHYSIYYTAAPELELRQDLKIGCLIHALYQFGKNHSRRLPVLKEPLAFSALVGDTHIQPGVTARLAPYITLENLIDGLNLQLRYTYTRHTEDTIRDIRNDKAIPSYLTQNPSSTLPAETITRNQHTKKLLSSWRSHYLTFTASYDTKEALQKTKFSPTFYTEYNYPFGGRGVSEAYSIGCGVALRF